jgi:hypothetical protein
MAEDVAKQTVYVRESTKKALLNLTSWLPSEGHGKYTHATQDDAIRFLMNRAGIDIENSREMQTPAISKITKAVRAGRCVALVEPDKSQNLCARKGLTPSKCEGCLIGEAI